MSEPIDASREEFTRQIRRPTYPLEAGADPNSVCSRAVAGDVHQPESANWVAFKWRALRQGRPRRNGPARGRSELHREDIMKPDLLGEIVLLGGTLIFVPLLLIVVTALMRA